MYIFRNAQIWFESAFVWRTTIYSFRWHRCIDQLVAHTHARTRDTIERKKSFNSENLYYVNVINSFFPFGERYNNKIREVSEMRETNAFTRSLIHSHALRRSRTTTTTSTKKHQQKIILMIGFWANSFFACLPHSIRQFTSLLLLEIKMPPSSCSAELSQRRRDGWGGGVGN